MSFFISSRNFDDQWSSNFHRFVNWCIQNVEKHQVRKLVFDNYQKCPVSLMEFDWLYSEEEGRHYHCFYLGPKLCLRAHAYCVHVTRHSWLTQLARNFGACPVLRQDKHQISEEWWSRLEFSSKQSPDIQINDGSEFFRRHFLSRHETCKKNVQLYLYINNDPLIICFLFILCNFRVKFLFSITDVLV